MAIVAEETGRVAVANGVLSISIDFKDDETVVESHNYVVADSPTALTVFGTETLPNEVARVEGA